MASIGEVCPEKFKSNCKLEIQPSDQTEQVSKSTESCAENSQVEKHLKTSNDKRDEYLKFHCSRCKRLHVLDVQFSKEDNSKTQQ